jgi:diguanylate cyclase (GGDEF)-like protein/PAS domain S-box-containing protein
MAGILIVEDEYIVAMDIQSSLEKNGFTVVGQANRGEQALQKAGELQPELILMDIGLKGEMDGIETAIQIKKRLHLPVIFLTAFGNPSVIERARLAEPFGYIFKPFEERELISNIKMALYKNEMDKKVRESEDKFRSVIEHSSDGILLADCQGNVVEWNLAAEQISGLRRSEVIGLPVSELIVRMLPREKRTTAVREALRSQWSSVVNSGYSQVLDQLRETEIETPQGLRRVVQSSGFAIQTTVGILAGAIMRDVTERKRVQEAIVNSEKRFRALIENGRDHISLLAVDGSLLWESPSVFHTLGYARNQFLGRSIFELIHPADSNWTRDFFAQIMETPGIPQEGILRLMRSDGSWRWIEATATNLLQEPAVNAIVVNYRDITNRRQAEERNLQLLSVLEASLNEIYIFDSQTLKFEYVNEGARRNLGYSMDTLLTLSPVDIKPEFTEASFRKLMEPLCLSEKDKLVFQTIHRRADGSEYPVEVHLQLVVREGRELFLGIVNDITERRKADADLRKLSQAVDQSANAIVITDTNGTIEYANAKFVEVSGYLLLEVIGKTPRILNSGEHSIEFYQNLWQTIKAGRVWSGEIHNRRKDGTLYWEDCTITPVFDLSHRLVNFIAVKEDITSRKMLQEVERNQRQLAETLRDTSAALNATLRLEEVLDRVLDNVGKLMVFDTAMVTLLEGSSIRKIRYRSRNPQELMNQTLIESTQAHLINFLQEMYETHSPCLIADTRVDPRWHAIPGLGWARSLISAPIIIRGHVAGVISLLSDTPSFFTTTHSERLLVFSDQSAIAIENAQLFEQAYYLSVTDPLTELTNRRHFFDLARLEFDRAHRYTRTLSVMMIDVDHFKNINDTFGHAVGDLTLHEIATRIKKTVRTIDIVARFGGEEFIVLMPETSLEEACQVAERVRDAVSNLPIEQETGTVLTALSLGVAEMSETSANIDQLIQCADRALYEAKAAGRNRVVGYKDVDPGSWKQV